MNIYRAQDDKLILVGFLEGNAVDVTFSYSGEYLASDDAAALSISLPLQHEPFSSRECSPYFRGLLPEGAALGTVSNRIVASDAPYIEILASHGLDCIGDIVINADAFDVPADYERMSMSDIDKLAASLLEIHRSLSEARLSLAGSQYKVGLYHDDDVAFDEGWFQPVGGAPSNYIVKFPRVDLPDLLIIEQLCLGAARACGLPVPDSGLMALDQPVFFMKRFDRQILNSRLVGSVHPPIRRHQEDLAQALGVLPEDKYLELIPSSAAAIASLIRERSDSPLEDVGLFASWLCFNYLVGNCDNHLKNISLLYDENLRGMRLAPFYDIASTTYFGERFSHEMGMRIGSAVEIDDVDADDFEELRRQLGISKRMLSTLAKSIADRFYVGLNAEAEKLEKTGISGASYIGDNLAEDASARMPVLSTLI